MYLAYQRQTQVGDSKSLPQDSTLLTDNLGGGGNQGKVLKASGFKFFLLALRQYFDYCEHFTSEDPTWTDEMLDS